MFLKETQQAFLENKKFILTEIKSLYSVTSELTLLGEFENYVFGFDSPSGPKILRLGHNSHRTYQLVQSEMHWLNFLSKTIQTFSIPKILKSKRENFVEKIPISDDSYFIVTGYEKAQGIHLNKSLWNERYFEIWGRTVGELHSITKEYKPSKDFTRPDWQEFDLFRTINDILPKGHEKIVEKYNHIVDFLRNLPKNRDSYGLIHSDAHIWNFFIHDGSLTLFDFDDCRYDWFINDIAVIVFHSVQYFTNNLDVSIFALKFLQSFFKGYNKYHYLDQIWLNLLPKFLKRQEILAFLSIYQDNALNDPWCKRFMNGRKERIENSIPFLELLDRKGNLIL